MQPRGTASLLFRKVKNGRSKFLGSQLSRDVNFPKESKYPGKQLFREVNFSGSLNRFKTKQCNRFKLAQTGSNWFKLVPVQAGSGSNQFKLVLVQKWFKLVKTGSNWRSLTGSNRFQFKPVQTSSNRFKPIWISSNRFQFKPIHTGSNQFKLVPVQNGSNWFKPVQTEAV